MSGLVVDSSLALSWCFKDEATAAPGAALDIGSRDGMYVPTIWLSEVANVLIVAERRGWINQPDSAQFVAWLLALPILLEPQPGSVDGAMRLARQHGLTVYDAQYLHLAPQVGGPLGTLDKQLRAAAVKEGVELLGV